MRYEDFWYIACESKVLKNKVLRIRLLGEWVALFRDENGKPIAMKDRCLHRAAPLSKGRVEDGQLVCPYHGWRYNSKGEVTRIPSEGPQKPKGPIRKLTCYSLIEKQGYVYLRLAPESVENRSIGPFSIPQYGEKGWKHVRLVNHFEASVTNCAENFVDIPHTVFIHPGIFRKDRGQRLSAEIERKQGAVKVSYRNESTNLGWFSGFLNPGGHEIMHYDNFYMPNITSVEYKMGPKRHLFICSQSIPTDDNETVVYTDLTFNYGLWNRVTTPIIRHHAQTIINQDIEILRDQAETIGKYGSVFQNSAADLIHIYIESIRDLLRDGGDPRKLSVEKKNIEFWI